MNGQQNNGMNELKSAPNVTVPIGTEKKHTGGLPKANLTGRRNGILTIMRCAGVSKGTTKWIGRCDCGTEKELFLSAAKKQTSCGCIQREKNRLRKTTHGESWLEKRTAEYSVWSGMVRRCYYKKADSYKCYGGRGITVVNRWRKYENFLSDMGRRPSKEHSIERVDNNGNYEPSNCKWGTTEEQNSNKRSNKFIKIDGETKTLAQWSRISGINACTLGGRLRRGWEPKIAINKPVQYKQRLYLSTV